jgi:hypothetical protein
MKIYELHRKTPNNIGDYWCNPSRYFKFENLYSEELMHNDSLTSNDALIVGGGGLIHKKFQLHINRILDNKPKVSAIWGIGHNFSRKHMEKTKGNVYYPDWTKKVNLIGIRDWIEGHYDTYLPCVTCMHPAFDKTYAVKNDIVYFTHAFKSKYNGKSAPHLKNNEMNFDKVIEFLGSGNTVITDSYHGAYWAQLLGKNVVLSSWSVKFNHMKYTPEFINSINETPPIVNNRVDGFLEESRYLNKRFYQKFLTLL